MGQGPRGAFLKVGEEEVGRVYANCVRLGEYKGWYWTARSDKYPVPRMNTCNELVGTIEEAKAA